MHIANLLYKNGHFQSVYIQKERSWEIYF